MTSPERDAPHVDLFGESRASHLAWSRDASAGPSEADVAASPDAVPATTSADSPDRRYELRAELGSGGMGRVWLAHDRRLGRDVALKVVRPDLDDAIAREGAITAALDHPGIVAVHDSGHLPDGRAFYVMPIVRGRSLASLAANAPADERLALVRRVHAVAEAVAHAHGRAIVHRDLKADNVLIGADGETLLVDWGLAARLDPAGMAPAERVGTLATMSPEQARSEPADRRSDVWGLGAVLFQVVSGELPWSRSNHALDARAVLAALAANQPPPWPGSLATAPAELRAIIARAHAPDPDQRYPDAHALAEDLARWLDGRPVSAHRYRLTDHLRRLWRTSRAPIAVGLVALVALLGLGTYTLLRVASERDHAEASLAELLLSQAELHAAALDRPEAEVFAAAAWQRSASPRALGVLAAFDTAPRPALVAEAALPACDAFVVVANASTLLCIRADGVARWDRALPAGPFTLTWHHPGAVVDAAWLGPSKRVFVSLQGFVARWLDATSGTDLGPSAANLANQRLMVAGDGSRVLGIASSQVIVVAPDDTFQRFVPCRVDARPLVAAALDATASHVASLCEDGELIVDDIASGSETRRPTPFGSREPEPSAVAWLDASHLVVGTLAGTVAVFDLTTGTITSSAQSVASAIWRIRVIGIDRVALEQERRLARIWAPTTGQWVGELPLSDEVRALWPGEGDEVHAVGRALRTWRIDHPAPIAWQRPHGISALAVSPDGLRVALGDVAGLTLLASESGQILYENHDLGRLVKAVAFSPDGRDLAAGTSGQGGLIVIGPGGLRRVAPDIMRRVGWLGPDPIGVPMDPWIVHVSGATSERIPGGKSHFVEAWFRDDGRCAALVDAVGGLWRLTSDPVRLTLAATAPGASSVAIADDCDTLFVVASEGVQRITTAQPEGLLVEPAPSLVTDLAVSSDGRFLALADRRGEVRIRATDDGHLVLAATLHDERAGAIAFSRDGSRLWSGGWDARVRSLSLGSLDARLDLLASREAAWGLPLATLIPGSDGN